MPENVFPFDLDGVTVLSETEIEHAGRAWQAARGQPLGQWALRPNWLREGARVDAPPEGEYWQADGEVLLPSVGPAWEGSAYVPAPSYVREQIFRRRAGLPLKQRNWQNRGQGPRIRPS